jgi:protein-L-isoaspartate(D-aspartate) O-methyltransferase
MLERIRQMGVSDERVMRAVEETDRSLFVPEEWRGEAYEDRPLPIGHGQTISQPYTVARMIELLIFNSKFSIFKSKVLEIGTGSGWQTCILAKLFKCVFSVEIVPELAREAELRIENLELRNVRIKIGDGKEGWKEYSPYDGIICGADANEVPKMWIEQLAEGGRMVCPVRGVMTRITKITNPKSQDPNKFQIINSKYYKYEEFGEYSFVPLI